MRTDTKKPGSLEPGFLLIPRGLAAVEATAMETASAVEAAAATVEATSATVEATSAMEAASAVEAAAEAAAGNTEAVTRVNSPESAYAGARLAAMEGALRTANAATEAAARKGCAACEAVAEASGTSTITAVTTAEAVTEAIAVTAAEAIAVAAVTAAETVTVAAIAVTVVTITPSPAVPGTGANEHAVYKPVGAVIAIGGASIRVIRIVTPCAVWGAVVVVPIETGWRHNCRTDSDADTEAHLGICGGRKRHKQERCQQNQQSFTHDLLLSLARSANA